MEWSRLPSLIFLLALPTCAFFSVLLLVNSPYYQRKEAGISVSPKFGLFGLSVDSNALPSDNFEPVESYIRVTLSVDNALSNHALHPSHSTMACADSGVQGDRVQHQTCQYFSYRRQHCSCRGRAKPPLVSSASGLDCIDITTIPIGGKGG